MISDFGIRSSFGIRGFGFRISGGSGLKGARRSRQFAQVPDPGLEAGLKFHENKIKIQEKLHNRGRMCNHEVSLVLGLVQRTRWSKRARDPPMRIGPF
jgi:hypothetical protein